MRISYGVKPGIPTRHRAFDSTYLDDWTLYQFRGWLVRKTTLEKDGRSHESVGAFANLPEATRVFVKAFAPGLLDIMRFKGREVVAALREAGERMDRVGLAVPGGELKSPLEGLPLNDGSIIRFDRELLIDLAFSRHAHWMAVREHSWLSPYVELHQNRKHKAHKAFCRGRPEPAWDPDVVSVYGDCYALAHFSDEGMQTVLDASAETSLSLQVYGEALSEEFRTFWGHYAAETAEFWRYAMRGLIVKANSRPAEDKQFALDRSEAMLECLRLYGGEALTRLRSVGMKIRQIGASEQAIKEFDPSVGMSLLDGSVASLDGELLEELAEEHRLLFEQLLAGYSVHPFRRVRELAERESAPSLDRDKARIYGYSVALATLNEQQWSELLSASM